MLVLILKLLVAATSAWVSIYSSCTPPRTTQQGWRIRRVKLHQKQLPYLSQWGCTNKEMRITIRPWGRYHRYLKACKIIAWQLGVSSCEEYGQCDHLHRRLPLSQFIDRHSLPSQIDIRNLYIRLLKENWMTEATSRTLLFWDAAHSLTADIVICKEMPDDIISCLYRCYQCKHAPKQGNPFRQQHYQAHGRVTYLKETNSSVKVYIFKHAPQDLIFITLF